MKAVTVFDAQRAFRDQRIDAREHLGFGDARENSSAAGLLDAELQHALRPAAAQRHRQRGAAGAAGQMIAHAQNRATVIVGQHRARPGRVGTEAACGADGRWGGARGLARCRPSGCGRANGGMCCYWNGGVPSQEFRGTEYS